MVIIAGLIGIGLALEAAERRLANRNALARKNDSQDEKDNQYGSGQVSETTQTQQEEQAFQEVQHYADFQKKLSERVSDDLMNGETSRTPTYAPEALNFFKRNLSQPQYLDPALFPPVSQTGLQSPVVITQERSEDGRMVWARSYAPVLWQCGITEDSFVHFINCYNETIQSCPRSEVINILAMGVGHYSNIAQVLTSKAVPRAVSLSKASQSLEPISIFLRQANSQLFAHHGLYAMVVTFSHRVSQIYTVDNSQSLRGTSAMGGESQFALSEPSVLSKDASSQRSPNRAQGNKIDMRKQPRRPNNRIKAGQKPDGLLKTAFEGAFSRRGRGRRTSVNNSTKGMTNGLGEGNAMIQSSESGEMDQGALYLLIVNDTPDTIAFIPANQGIQPQFHNHNYNQSYDGRPVFQIDTSNQPRTYDHRNKGESTGTIDTSFAQQQQQQRQRNDPPPAYDSMMRESYDNAQADGGDYCVPTL